MFKLTSLALLGLFQIALAMDLPCGDKNDMTKCRVAMAEMIDIGIQNAQITLLKNLVHGSISMFREIDCGKHKVPLQDCKDAAQRSIGLLKNDLKALNENCNDTEELKFSFERLVNDEKRNDLVKLIGHDDMAKLAEEFGLIGLLEKYVEIFVDEVYWHMKEASNELKEHDIKIDEIEESFQKIKTINENSEIGTKLEKTLKEIVKLGEAMNMNWAKDAVAVF